jgi:energy-coupling factor transporter ATP-binding protein EcfA2
VSLNNLNLANFTAFSNLNIDFSPGLNVIIGENATGKSHLLKLGYSIAYILHESGKFNEEIAGQPLSTSSKSWFQRRIAQKLVGVFKPDTLGRLCRRGPGRLRAEVRANLSPGGDLRFSFSSTSKAEVKLLNSPNNVPTDAPIFFPPKEVMSLNPGFMSLYEQRELAVDETYYDLCKLLNVPVLKGKRAFEIADLVNPLATIMDGAVREESGRFYLAHPGLGRLEISLVAEGLRKVATLAYLAINGSLTDKGMLFWDEPESNLNSRIVKKLCESLIMLVNKGVQIFVATHDLFLMKELSFLVEESEKKTPARFFGLRLEAGEVRMEQGELLEDIGTLVALEEVLKQDDEEQAFYVERMQ